MSNRVPDVVGEISGFRAWAVETHDVSRLRSFYDGTIWVPLAWTRASCPHPDAVSRPIFAGHEIHEVPDESCSCGIYAAASKERLIRMGWSRTRYEHVVAIGEVGLAGKVIECERGWRAERARPLRLWLPYEHWRLAKPLTDAYRVPVELANTLVCEAA